MPGENPSWDNTVLLPTMKENDWHTDNDLGHWVNQYSCLTPLPADPLISTAACFKGKGIVGVNLRI